MLSARDGTSDSLNQKKRLYFVSMKKVLSKPLTRTQPGLPMKKGRGQTMTHDYKRHGTRTLFAALNVATGESGWKL